MLTAKLIRKSPSLLRKPMNSFSSQLPKDYTAFNEFDSHLQFLHQTKDISEVSADTWSVFSFAWPGNMFNYFDQLIRVI